MSIETRLAKIIDDEADKWIKRHHAYHNKLHQVYERNIKRVDNAPKKIIQTPYYWSKDKKFNPFYVKRKSKSIARSIAKKIENKTYNPSPPLSSKVSKPGGGERNISVYQIPDSAVSKLIFNRLLAKNKHRFSSFAYAYRNDRNVHFAIQDIHVDLSNDSRVFVSEFDFSNFFGSIPHDFLNKQFDENGFFVSEEERYVINSFLRNKGEGEEGVGVPLGTSISLFLANLVCWRLDKNLEKEGLKFARYADDIVIWSADYQKICNSFSIINDFSGEAKIKINLKKSDGISLLSKEGFPSELSNVKTGIEFLGYEISVDKISIKKSSVLKIKKQISYLLFQNLIQPLKGAKLKGLIIPSNNRDKALLTAIMQIRRYMYGGLSE